MQILWQVQHFVYLHVQISWQAQRFGILHVQISWQAQRFGNLHAQIAWRTKHFDAPPCADVVVDVALWEPPCADFFAGTMAKKICFNVFNEMIEFVKN